MKLVLFFVVILASVTAFGQGLPKGAKALSQEERSQLISQIESKQFSESIKGGNTVPKFTFTFNGDYRSGVTVFGRNTDPITSEITLIGVKRYPGQAAQYLSAFYIIGLPVEAGAVWYPLEEGKKSLWNEDMGIATYEMLVIQGGVLTVFRAERNYNNYDTVNRAHSFIDDGVAVYDASGNLTIYLFGRFVGEPGAVIRNENGWEWAVFGKAISANQHMLTIDTSKILGFEKYGDVKISVANGSNRSDDITVRIKPFGTAGASGQDVLKTLMKRYVK